MLRYFAEQLWGDRRNHRIEIHDREFTGAATRIILASKGFTLETGNRDNDIMAPIFVSRGKLTIFDPGDVIRQILYTIDPNRFTVIHYIEDYAIPGLDVELLQIMNQFSAVMNVQQSLTRDVKQFVVPTLLTPVDNFISEQFAVTFTWAQEAIRKYRIQVASDEHFGDVIFDIYINGEESIELTIPAAHEDVFYWHVRNEAGEGGSDYSETRAVEFDLS
jgi:hypothetical protein